MSSETSDNQPLSEMEIERLKMMELADRMREKLLNQDEISYENIATRALSNQD